MKTLTVRLPDEIVAEINAESKERNVTKSDIVRERLQGGARRKRDFSPLNGIADLVGSVDGLPVDLSARRKDYLRARGYGGKRSR